MFRKLLNLPQKLPLALHGALLLLSFVWFQWIKGKLDASYAASKHPVDYATGQTSFDGAKVKEYYNVMLDSGTLDIYWQTQFIDFGFILGMFLMGLFAGTMIMRFANVTGWTRKLAILSASLIMSGALLDAVENLISFVMLSQPLSFANWIALPYSLAAVLKFTCIALGMLVLILAIVFLIVEKIRVARNSKS